MNIHPIILSLFLPFLSLFPIATIISNATAEFKIVEGTNSICNGGCIKFEVDIDNGVAPFNLDFGFRVSIIPTIPLSTIETSDANQQIELCFSSGVIRVTVNDDPIIVETFGIINSGTVILRDVNDAGSCDVTLINENINLDIVNPIDVMHPGSFQTCMSEERCYNLLEEENAKVHPDYENLTITWWDGNPAQPTSVMVDNEECFDVMSTNILYVRIEDATGCMASARINWTGPSLPDPNPSFTMADFCINGIASQPIPEVSDGKYSFATQLAPDDTAELNCVSGEITNASGNTRYDIMYTVSNGDCELSSVQSITIWEPPAYIPIGEDCDATTGVQTYTFQTSCPVDVVVEPAEYNDQVRFDNTTCNYRVEDVDEGIPISITITSQDAPFCETQVMYTPQSCGCDPIDLPRADQEEYIYCGDNIPMIGAGPPPGSPPNIGINWYSEQAGGNPLATNTSTFTPLREGTYWAEAVDAGANCSSSSRTPIEVIERDRPNFIADTETQCSADGTMYTARFFVEPDVEVILDNASFTLVDNGNGMYEVLNVPIDRQVFMSLDIPVGESCVNTPPRIDPPSTCTQCDTPEPPIVTYTDEDGTTFESEVDATGNMSLIINGCAGVGDPPSITADADGDIVAWYIEETGGSPFDPDNTEFVFIGEMVVYAETQSACGPSDTRTRVEFIINNIPSFFSPPLDCDNTTGTYGFTVNSNFEYVDVLGVGNPTVNPDGTTTFSGIPQGTDFEVNVIDPDTGCLNPVTVDGSLCSGCMQLQENINTFACAGVTSVIILGEEFTPTDNDFTIDRCDTLYNVFVDFLDEIRTMNDELLCDDEIRTVGTSTYDVNNPSGMDVFESELTGCDSIVETNLTFMSCNQNITIEETTPLCAGDSTGVITITVTEGTPTFTYTIEQLDGTESQGGIIPMLNSPVSQDELPAGTYEITIFDASMMEIEVRTVEIENPEGMMGSIEIVSPITCGDSANGVIRADITGGAGDYMYVWNNDATAQEVGDLGVGSYSVIVTDANGCMLEIPEIALSGDISIVANVDFGASDCENGGGGFIEITNPEGGEGPYEYSIDGGDTFANQTLYEDLMEGDYAVFIKDNNECIQPLDELMIVLPELADLNIDVDTMFNIFAGGSVQLMPQPNFDPISYTWSPSIGLSCADCPDPIASPSSTTTYTVSIEDISGCSITADITISVDEDGIAYLPNVMTPGADEESAMFYPMLPSDVNGTMDMTIFDRWGNKVHEALNADVRDQNAFWRTDFGQDNVREGVYVYYVVLRLDNLPTETRQGSITVLK